MLNLICLILAFSTIFCPIKYVGVQSWKAAHLPTLEILVEQKGNRVIIFFLMRPCKYYVAKTFFKIAEKNRQNVSSISRIFSVDIFHIKCKVRMQSFIILGQMVLEILEERQIG